MPAHVYYHLYKIKTLNGIGFDKRKHDLVLVIDRFFFVVVAFVKSFSMVVVQILICGWLKKVCNHYGTSG